LRFINDLSRKRIVENHGRSASPITPLTTLSTRLHGPFTPPMRGFPRARSATFRHCPARRAPVR
jgi:hypothetical protein